MQQLRVNTAALQAMATNWGASAAELNETTVPTLLCIWQQPSATAVSAAHVDVAAFTAELARRMDMRASHVADANIRYVAGEDHSADELSAALNPTTIV